MDRQDTLPIMKEFMKVGTKLVCVATTGYYVLGEVCTVVRWDLEEGWADVAGSNGIGGGRISKLLDPKWGTRFEMLIE